MLRGSGGALGAATDFRQSQRLVEVGVRRDPFTDGDTLSDRAWRWSGPTARGDGQVRSTSANATRIPPVASAWRSANQAPASAVVTAALAVS
jgi:hypothetical protein